MGDHDTTNPSGNLEEIPPWLISAVFGGLGLGSGVGGWIENLAFLRAVNVPLTVLCLLPCLWAGMRARAGFGFSFFAILACGTGCLAALASLVIDRDHPWTG